MISERRSKAGREFKEISALVSAGEKGFMDEASRTRIQDTLIQSETLQGLIVYGSDNAYIFQREEGIIIPVHNGNGFQFVNRLGFSKEPFIVSVPNTTISALYSIFDYQLIIGIFKQSLVAILAAFCVAFAGLLIQFLSKKPASIKQEDNFLTLNGKRGIDESDLPELDLDVKTGDDSDFELPYIDFELPEIDSDFELPEIDSDLKLDDIDFNLPEPDSDPQSDNKDEEPNYVPAAQSDTVPHLESALQQCTLHDQDLACVIIESKEVGGSVKMYQDIAGQALEFFGITEGLFQKDSLGMSLILPGETLEECRTKVETFHKKIIDKYGDFFWEPSDLCIGISARQGRQVDADRLLLEASTALKKALNDPQNPIISFKIDPERYKAFLNQKK